MPVVEGRRGRAFDLRDSSVTASDVAAAIAGEEAPISVRCPAPGPVHDRVGVVRPDREYPIRAALAATARALGREAAQRAELERVRERLRELEPPDVSLAAERRRLAETDAAADLEERVAELRGQLEAARERGDDPDALEDATERAVADLAARRTERLAAEQSLERAREDARERRDRREERLRLQDRERNVEREARRELAESLRSTFERALAAVPGDAAPCDCVSDEPPWRVGDPVAGALAVCRIAPVSAPVVVAADRFPSARAATAALAAPAILVEPDG